MIDLLLLFVPFFALVLLGWGAARTGLMPLEGIGALTSFVLYFGLSAMIFRLAAGGALHQAGLGGLLLVYGAAGVLIVMLAMAWGARLGLARRDAGLAALATAFPNTGFLGLPLLTGLLGAQATGPVAATLLVDVLLLSSVCLAWAHSAEPRNGASHALLQALQGALRNPLLWSMALGMLAAEFGLVLARPMDETLRLLSLSATPTALFALGAMLARAQVQRPKAATGHRSPATWLPTGLKLLVHPALVWGIGSGLSSIGVPLPKAGLLALTLAAALPSASNVSMLAERDGADTGLVARIILWTTAGAVLTLALWAQMLGVAPATSAV